MILPLALIVSIVPVQITDEQLATFLNNKLHAISARYNLESKPAIELLLEDGTEWFIDSGNDK